MESSSSFDSSSKEAQEQATVWAQLLCDTCSLVADHDSKLYDFFSANGTISEAMARAFSAGKEVLGKIDRVPDSKEGETAPGKIPDSELYDSETVVGAHHRGGVFSPGSSTEVTRYLQSVFVGPRGGTKQTYATLLSIMQTLLETGILQNTRLLSSAPKLAGLPRREIVASAYYPQFTRKRQLEGAEKALEGIRELEQKSLADSGGSAWSKKRAKRERQKERKNSAAAAAANGEKIAL